MPFKADEILARIGAVPHTPAGDRRLVAMLRQDGTHLSGLSTGEAERVRGRILAAFAGRRLPAAALAAIREELRTSISPAVLAGAARALAGLGAAEPDLGPLLAAASERIALRDQYVAFDGAEGAAITAREEIGAALKRLSGSPPGCCAKMAAQREAAAAEPFSLSAGAIGQVIVEDQFEARDRFEALLRARASLVAFFYTRCMNPAKCSLTVSRLAAFARHADAIAPEGGPNVLALSYDPAFDDPARLHAYGRDRGFPFGRRARLVRCRSGWNAVRRAFALDVGYGASTVNAHARELFLVMPDLRAIPLDPEAIADCDTLLARIAAQSPGELVA